MGALGGRATFLQGHSSLPVMGFPGTVGLEVKVQAPGTSEVWRATRLWLPLLDLWVE